MPPLVAQLPLAVAVLAIAMLALVPGAKAGLFTAHVVSPQPSQPTAIRMADLDLDGDVDVLVAMDSGLVWLENRNDLPGRFNSPRDVATDLGVLQDMERVVVVTSAGHRPYIVVATNLPGEPGTVVLVDEQRTLSNGALTYSSVTLQAPTQAESLAYFPVSIDGVLLPCVAFVEQQLVGLWVVGPPGKEMPAKVVLSIATASNGIRWTRIVVGAFTGPNSTFATDMVVSTESELYLFQRFQYSADTPFVFAPRGVILTGLANVRRLERADVDGDGWDDLLVHSDGDATGSKLLYVRNTWRAPGDVLAAPVQIGADNQLVNCAAMQFVDVNNDGNLDIVALSAPFHGGDVLQFINNGATHDAPQWTLPAVPIPRPPAAMLPPGGGWEPTGMGIAELDSDGFVEIMVSSAKSNNIFHYKNDGTGNFTLLTGINVLAPAAQPYILRTLPPLVSEPAPQLGRAEDDDAAADATSAMLPDIITLTRNLVSLHGINRQSHANGLRFDLQGGVMPDGFDPATHGDVSPFFLAPGDVDHDGIDDIVTSEFFTGRTILLRRNATGALLYSPLTSELLPPFLAPNMFQLHLVDLDNDTYLDLIGVSYAGGWWLRNRGAEAPGVFENATTHMRWLLGPSPNALAVTATGTVTVACADFDLDGRLDVVFGVFIETRAVVFYQSRAPAPAGTFDLATPLELMRLGAASFVGVAAGDLDGNGAADVAIMSGSGLLVVLNTNSRGNNDADSGAYDYDGDAVRRNFSLPGITLSNSVTTGIVLATDLDGDGDNDLVAGTTSGEDLIWFRCVDAATVSFAGAQPLSKSDLQGCYWIDVADLDGDGDNDMVGGYLVAAATRWYEQLSCDLDIQLGGDLNRSTNGHVPLGGQANFWVQITNLGPDPALGLSLSSVFETGLHNPQWRCDPVLQSSSSSYDSDTRVVAVCDTNAGAGAINGLTLDLPAGTAVNISVTAHVSAQLLFQSDDNNNLIAVSLSIDTGGLVMSSSNSTETASANLRIDLCPRDPLKLVPGSCGCGRADRKDVGGNVQCSDFVGSGGFVALLVVLPVALTCTACLLVLLLLATAFGVAALRSRAHDGRKVLMPPPYARIAYSLADIDMAPIEDHLRQLGPFLDVVALMNAFDALLLNTDFLSALISSMPSPLRRRKRAAAAVDDDATPVPTPRHLQPDVQRQQLAVALVYTYHAHNQADTLLRHILRTDPSSLLADFRQDDMFTAMYRCFTRIVGLRWLWNALALPLNELLERVLDDIHDRAPPRASTSPSVDMSASQRIAFEDDDDGGDDDNDSDADSDAERIGGDTFLAASSRRGTAASAAAAILAMNSGAGGTASPPPPPLLSSAASTAAAAPTSVRFEPRSASSHLIQLNVHVAVQTMLMRVTSSADSFPDDLRSVMQACRKTALSTLPGGGPAGASGGLRSGGGGTLTQQQASTQQQMLALVTGPLVGLLFNRFICPAIAQPRQYGLIANDEHLNAEQKRALASAAKLLLTYATGSGAISEMDSAPIPGEQLMFTNHMRVRDFLDAVSTDSYESDVDAATTTATGGGGSGSGRGSNEWGTDSTVGGPDAIAAKDRKKLLISANEARDLRTGPPAGRVPGPVRLDSLKIVYVHCARYKPRLIRAIRKQEARATAAAADAFTLATSPAAAAAAAADIKAKHDLIVRFRRLVDAKHLLRQAEKDRQDRRSAVARRVVPGRRGRSAAATAAAAAAAASGSTAAASAANPATSSAGSADLEAAHSTTSSRAITDDDDRIGTTGGADDDDDGDYISDGGDDDDDDDGDDDASDEDSSENTPRAFPRGVRGVSSAPARSIVIIHDGSE